MARREREIEKGIFRDALITCLGHLIDCALAGKLVHLSPDDICGPDMACSKKNISEPDRASPCEREKKKAPKA